MAQHVEKPGKGVMFSEQQKKSPQHPDFKGFVVLEMDYKAGEKLQISGWQKNTAYGPLISLSEDNYSKKKRLENDGQRVQEFNRGHEVTPAYAKKQGGGRFVDDDSDVPFADPYKGRSSYVV